ncbi:BrnA antitoxin of type II toxin-antitoxin system [Yoonia maritima]|uniref:BrnA antitoxin of type II toxin-antitoxin system n=1 Tax=Yoonia maritima TaxID=1435347 RepID=A0A2T0VY84_9RHOB|nr:BrnA antitoxin family protein [Yoonia maritima]PRY77230.1 BrnA antitoxin of type II toxin-antitoxin system [Yoonia maritima]
MPRMTKAERIARQKMMRYLYEENVDATDLSLELRDKVPLAWHTLEHDLDVEEPKVKITLRLDESVAKFYRAMGPGYQARISRILGLWANMKIGEALRMEEAIYAQMKILNRLDREAAARGEPPKSFGADVKQDVLPD